ncbi:MAG: SDR family oxidoreductase, partial [Methanomicrobiales archaeon]|nr:SDR family oxidoreductase [Methanomicrobiales archaeon]
AASKAALLAYMKNTASLVARHGIRMNAVSPGNIFFEGGTWDRKLREDRTAVERYIGEQVPLGRFGTPEEIARVVCFLASDASAFITGANVIIDGGQTRGP